MGRILLYILLAGNAIASIFVPWIGVLAYYIVSIFNPAGVWYWVFTDIRFAFYASIPPLLGFSRLLLSGRINLASLLDRQNFYIVVIWLSAFASYVFSPFGHYASTTKGYSVAFNSDYLITTFSKGLLFYFVSIPLIKDKRKVFLLAAIMLGTVIYYTYWANERYLRMGLPEGRLAGPGVDQTLSAIYTDENCFALLFVTGIPFIYYLGMHYKNWCLKAALLLCIPFAWHAIFLTASRGGLIGLCGVSLIIWIRSKYRLLGLGLLAALIVAFALQGGGMRERIWTIVYYDEDSSSMGRINAWKAGLSMMLDHPITGVGIGNFTVAYPSYSNTTVRVAHNTIVQLGAETGIFSAIAYILIFVEIFVQGKKFRKDPKRDLNPLMKAIHDAMECSLYGFFICSLFLNLGTYELFVFLLLIRATWRQAYKSMTSDPMSTIAAGTVAA